MYNIALDAMGGDHAPREIIHGAYLAVKEYPVHVTLVGQLDVLKKEIAQYKDWPDSNISLLHASEVIEMAESPANAFRKKKDSSIHIGLHLVKDKVAQAFVSAGNTGAVMTASVLILGKVPNVERPAIATIFPSQKGPVVLLDMGSNVDCKPQYLSQFAIMGNCLAASTLHISNPRVGLLNIGEEKEKGNALTQEAFDEISKLPLNFIGNIEGKDILKGQTDVVVCDGFVGNAILKFGEGIVEIFMGFFKYEAKKSVLSLIGLLFLAPALKRFKKKFDYEEYGGAPLLGINGVSIVAHGRSNAKAIKNAIWSAWQAVDGQITEKIREAVKV